MGCAPSGLRRKSVAENVLKKKLDEDARALYALIDQDGDGMITYNEIGKILKVIGVEMTEHEAVDFLNALDLNGDGFIDFKEFKRHLRVNMKQRSNDLVALFKFLDIDNDNAISYYEFTRGMEILGEKISNEEVTLLMKKYYANVDDKINFEQFCQLFHKFV